MTFEVPIERKRAWLEREEAVWSSFLADQDGFLRKEVWQDDGEPGTVHAVIWWESLDRWQAIGPDQVADVDAAMGDLLIEPTMRSFTVVRTVTEHG